MSSLCCNSSPANHDSDSTIDHDNPFNHPFKPVEMTDEIMEAIRKNIGVRRWKWMQKSCGAFLTASPISSGFPGESYIDDIMIVSAKSEYIGSLMSSYDDQDIIRFVYNHRLVQTQSQSPMVGSGCHPLEIGFNEKEQAWYGWTHRGFGKFFVGYHIKPSSIVDVKPYNYPATVTTLAQAKGLALTIADELS